MAGQTNTLFAGRTRSSEHSPGLTTGLIGVCDYLILRGLPRIVAYNKPVVGHGADIKGPVTVTKGVVA